jgi:RNA polymerase-binding transcription factor DksA
VNDHKDNLDQAAELQDEFNKKGLAEVRKALVPETHPDFDGRHCIECDSVMPQQRIDAGRIHCTPCQSVKEQRSRLFR